MEHRGRATGWRHAKLSGHENEERIKALLDSDPSYAAYLLSRINWYDKTLSHTSVGGLHETDVESVIPGARKTKSKTDLKLFFTDGSQTNISIKKSLGGQVYFVRAGLFIQCFEAQFGKKIPPEVQRAIHLFWAAAEDAPDIIHRYADPSDEKAYTLQLRHKSLNAATLRAYDEALYDALLSWFRENAYHLAFLSFASGAAKESSEWADFVWYKNLLGEHDIDEVFSIDTLCKACEAVAERETYYGATNGGTTIQLPFGFVQWHQRQLQFHHSYEKIKHLLHP